MDRAFNLGNVFGIQFRLHYTWFIIFILVTVSLVYPDWFQWQVDWTGTHWLWTQGLDPSSLRIKLFVCQPTTNPTYPLACDVAGESYRPGELGVWLEQGQTYYVLACNLPPSEVGCYTLWLQP